MFFTHTDTFATHLMGGDFTYQYLYKSGGYYYYKIRIDMYRDCQNSTTNFDYSIAVGVYYNNATRTQLRTETLYMGTETKINPPSGGSKCSFMPLICIKHTYYEGVISLPPTTTGFHLTHVRCCRNNLVNFVPNTGQTYYAFIPPNTDANGNTIINNSPYFNSIPTPYVCAQDTVSISYSATDSDGDSLVYELAHPWAGGSDNDPIPVNPMNLPLPIVKGTYSTGYSLAKPFGNNGYSAINSATGLVTIMVPYAGFWEIAVDVKEYRDGVLISTVRRDIELIVLNCPPNNFPKLIDPIITTFIVEEGNTITFDIVYTDYDKDSLTATKEGDIFGGSSSTVPPPYATLPLVKSNDTLKTKFEWKTSCDHGCSNPYFFTLRVSDNGCPPKTTISIFQIYVQPFKGPDSISGPVNICEYTDSLKYKAYGTSKNSLLSWNIIGGNIQTPQGQTEIKAGWGKSGQGTLELYETSKYGCGPVKMTKKINIHPLPVADAGADKTICSGDTLKLGTIPKDTLAKYIWSTSKNLNDSNSAQPLFTVKNITGSPIVYKYFLTVRSSKNCTSFDSVLITVNPEPEPLSIKGNKTPCFLGTFPYEVKNNAGSVYYWSVSGGTIQTPGNTYKTNITWQDTASGILGVFEINKYNCLGDTQFLPVQIVKPGAKIFGPEVVCPHTVNVEYWVKERSGSIYDWKVINGVRADGIHQKSAIKVNWPDSGSAMIKTVETTKEGCVSDTAYFPVLISYHLKTSPIEGDTFVCEFSNEPYQVMNVNGSTFNWSVNGGDILSGNTKNLINVFWGTKGAGLLKVRETSYDSINDKYCYGDTVYRQVVINPIPHTSPISGKPDVCEYDTSFYSVTGFPGSVFFWSISDTNIPFVGQGFNKIRISWQKEGVYVIKVWELTKDSCTSTPEFFTVSVHPNPRTSKINGSAFVCYPNNSNIPYSVTGFANSTYKWTIEGGAFPAVSTGNQTLVNWITSNTGKLSVVETTEWGCIGILVEHLVNVDSLAPVFELVTTVPENDKIIETKWDLVNSVHFKKKIYLYRNDEGYRSWNLIDSFSPSSKSYIDQYVKTASSNHHYKISVENLCKEQFYSEAHRNVLLKGKKLTEFDVRLHWNEYINWPEGVEKYNIYYRKNDESQYLLVATTSDTIVDLDAAMRGIKQTYRVVAVRNNKPEFESWSNEISFIFEPVLQIPNAFTPNNDGLNDHFEVMAGNIHTFELRIFNEWGQEVFKSNSPNNMWDGKYNGKDCPTDVYVVVIRYQGNGTPKRYTGSVTLLR